LDATKAPLEQIKTLMRDFLDRKISAGEFEMVFFPTTRVLWNISEQIMDADPIFAPIWKAFTGRSMSSEEFESHQKSFIARWAGISHIPLSEKDKALSHLWVEVDAYRADPQDREPGLHIGEEELRQVVQETLMILNE
jgi:hypothetical protein